jgi:hydroxymethylglutaryl-CoA lyase
MHDVMIHEVGPRDGLQMEKEAISFEQKISWISSLMNAGVDIIQVGSFVHPQKVPQMADTDRLFAYFKETGNKPANVILSGLVLNEKGLERGEDCGVGMYCMGVSASDTHSRKNTGMSTDEALQRISAMAQSAVKAHKKVQVSVQSAFGCGFEGPIPQERVIGIVRKYLECGLTNISLADTAGHALPDQVSRLFHEIKKLDPVLECTAHFHNTYGMGIANCVAAMNAGVKCFESSIAGLGGCPFTKVAAGNVCTEDFVHYLHRIGKREDIKLDSLITLARDVAAFFNRDMPGLVYKTGALRNIATS